jgi:hypothetical protein
MMHPPGQTIRELIAFIAQKHRADVDTVLLDRCILNEDEPHDAFSDSPNQIFAFRGPGRLVITTSPSLVSRPRRAQQPLHPKPPSVTQPMSAYVRDFRSFKKIWIIVKGAFRKVKLFDDSSTHELIAIKFFDSEITQARDGSATFVPEIDAFVLFASHIYWNVKDTQSPTSPHQISASTHISSQL